MQPITQLALITEEDLSIGMMPSLNCAFHWNNSLVVLSGGSVTIHNFKDLAMYCAISTPTSISHFCCSDNKKCYGMS
jgi:hypothetical protein